MNTAPRDNKSQKSAFMYFFAIHQELNSGYVMKAMLYSLYPYLSKNGIKKYTANVMEDSPNNKLIEELSFTYNQTGGSTIYYFT